MNRKNTVGEFFFKNFAHVSEYSNINFSEEKFVFIVEKVVMLKGFVRSGKRSKRRKK